jgi:uncharacterized protein YbjQ (UPF0145 family)
MIDVFEQLRPYLIAITATLIVLWLLQRLWRRLRRRKAKLHPSLAKYGGPDSELAEQRRQAAARIMATSSSDHLSGYEIVEQIEAVYVDGFRSPTEAFEGLKATAALKGGNALINVRHERTISGRCSATGDAVRAHRLTPPPPEPQPPEPPAPPQDP